MKGHPAHLTFLAMTLAAGSLNSADGLQRLSPTFLVAARAKEQTVAAQVLTKLDTRLSSLGLDERHSFAVKNTHTDPFGQTHVRVQQLYQGIPVWAGQTIIHITASGKETEPTEALYRGIDISTSPSIEVKEALSLVQQELAPTGLYSTEPTASLVVFPVIKEEILPGHERQVNAMDIIRKVEHYVLAYHVHTEQESPHEGFRHMDYIIDAHTGNILSEWNSLQTEAATGTGNSQYNGTVSLSTNKLPDGTYEMRDMTRGVLPHPITGEVGNTVRNMDHLPSSNSSMGTIYTDADNAWGDGANYIEGTGELGTTSANGQTAAVDAAFGLQSTWDYYLNVHNRLGIDGVGRSAVMRVHSGNAWDNANWQSGCFCMTFGDGNTMTTLTVIDVVSHELSHGITSTTNALIYAGESGGLNEANSDIHGTLVEFYSRGGSGSTIGNTGGNWTIGEQLSATPMRFMYRPDLDNKRSPNYWYPSLASLDVHYSSGPMNRAFYFLSQGATAAGDTSTAINTTMPGIANANFLPTGMTGVGNEIAAAIWYRASTVYMTMGSTYMDARNACERAATDLYGASSPAVQAVENAFAGINVGLVARSASDTTAPVVSASIVGGLTGSLTFNATATDNVGVTRVEFYVDNASVGLGTLSGSDYTLTLDSTKLNNGAHILVVKAWDASGNLGTSDAVLFNTANPLLHPLLNGDFELGLTNWTGYRLQLSSTTVNGGLYALLLGGFGNASASSPASAQAYQLGLPVPAGATSLTIGFDVQMNTTDTSTSNVSVLRVAMSNSPVTSANYYGVFSHLGVNPIAASGSIPAAEQITPGSWIHKTYTISSANYTNFNAMKGKNVSIFFNSQEKATLPTSWFIDNVTLDVATTVPSDTTPPVANPPSVSVSGTSYTFTATATDDVGVTLIDFYVDGNKMASSSTSPFTTTVDGSLLGNGDHTLKVYAWDAAGNGAQSSGTSFNVLVPIPRGTQIESESNNTILSANPFQTGKNLIQGTLPTLLDVDFFSFTLQPGETLTLDLTGPVYSDYDLALLDGTGVKLASSGTPTSTEHLTYTNKSTAALQVYARVNPFAGPSTMPYVLTPTFSTDAVAPTVTASIGGSGTNLIFSATATDAGSGVTRVEFYVDNLLRGTATSTPYTLNFDASGLSDGVHVLTAKAYDPAGNIGISSPVNFTTASAPVAAISALDMAIRGQTGLLASVPVQVGATYAWTVTGGTLISANNLATITFIAGDGDQLTLTLIVTNAVGQTATSTKVISLVPNNLDLDSDSMVDAMDMAIFVKAMGTQRGDANYDARADLNGDGKVDAADIKIFLAGLDK